MPGRGGLTIVLGSVGLGMLVTIVAGSGPGLILGIFLVAGTVAAALLVRPRDVHLMIPVPALAYLAASVIAGAVHDRAALVSRTAMAVSAVQWLASGFLAIALATAIVLALTIVAWQARRRTRPVAGRLDPRAQHSPVDDDSRSWDDYYREDKYNRQDEYGADVPRVRRDRYRTQPPPYAPQSRHRQGDDDYPPRRRPRP